MINRLLMVSAVALGMVGVYTASSGQDPAGREAVPDQDREPAEEPEAGDPDADVRKAARQVDALLRASAEINPPPHERVRRGQELRRELEAEANGLRVRLRDLLDADKLKEAEQVERRLAEVMAQLAQLPPPPPPGAIEEEASRPKREIGEAPGVGPGERADRLEREGREIVAPWDGRGIPGPRSGIEEMEQRIRHLEAAADNLHAAGLHEPADHFQHQADQMRHELLEEQKARAARDKDQALAELHEMVHQLREEVEELRQTVIELRERVDKLSTRVRRQR